MAGEKIGLGGRLTLEHREFTRGMDKSRDAMGRFIKTADKGSQAQQTYTDKNGKVRDAMGRFVPGATRATAALNSFTRSFAKSAATMKAGAMTMRSGLNSITQGATQAAMGLAPLTLAMGAGVAQAAKFEQQMSAVGSITRATEDDLASLRKEAQYQGVVSVFSATESAQAMEFLARAGAKPKEVIAGLGGVMAAAAADSIDLATSADIVSQIVKGMGMGFGQASHVADVLALTSAKANTNIIALGESFTYGVSQAKSMGITVEETSAIFGKLADAGLRGSLGGTAFTNMLLKLAKPTKDGRALLKKWGIQLNNSDGSLRKIASIVDDVQAKINRLGTATEKAEAAGHIFGIRGARAYNALATAGSAAVRKLEKELVASSFGIGAAQEMANKRLDNFLGAIKLFASSVESVSIEFFGPMLGSFKEATQDLTGGLNDVLFAVQGLRNMQGAAATASIGFSKATAAGFAEQFKFADKMEARAGTLAEATIQALQAQAIGEEKLTRAQREARAKSFEEFVDMGMRRAGMQEKFIQAELKAFRGIAKAGLAASASQEEQLKLRNVMLESIRRQTKGEKALGAEQQRNNAEAMQAFMDQQVARAKQQTAARAFLERQKTLDKIMREQGPTAKLIAEGFLDAIESIKASIKDGIAWVRALGDRLRDAIGEDRLRQFTKFASIGAVVAAGVTPVILGLGLFSMVLKGLLGPLVGVAKLAFGFSKILWGLAAGLKTLVLAPPILLAVGLITAAFMAFRQEGESMTDTVTRLWTTIKTGALAVYNEGIVPFVNGFMSVFMPMLSTLEATWNAVWSVVSETFDATVTTLSQVFNELFTEIFGGTGDMSTNFIVAGQAIAQTLGDVAQFVMTAFGSLLNGVMKVIKFLAPVLVTPFRTMANAARMVFGGILDLFRGDFMVGIKKLATAIGDVLTMPIRMMMTAMLKLVRALPSNVLGKVIGEGTLAKMEKFAKHGFAGPPPKAPPKEQALAKVVPLVPQVLKPIEMRQKKLAQVINLDERRTGDDRNRAILKAIESLTAKAPDPKIRKALVKAEVEASDQNVMRARAILEQRAAMQREDRLAMQKAGEQKTLTANIGVEDKRELNIKNQMCIDGEGINVASAKHKQGLYNRTGAKTQPWVRRMAIEAGA